MNIGNGDGGDIGWVSDAAQSVMVVSEVAGLADAPGVELAICVLALFSHLVTPLRVIAILAHARRVVVVCDMLTFIDNFAMFNLL